MARLCRPPLGVATQLGLRNLRWPKPVYAGDTLEYASEVLELRVSKSRPRYGLMTMRITGTNQRGELTVSFVSTSFIERRAAE